ncbi:MAG: hypothetical protein V1788_02185 [Nanoarchaeota archaeon]|nr:hypothetical protein [Nanoarchaeota archaeon]
MNRRGDIPVVVLVIGVVAICSLAIFSFITFSKVSDKSNLGVELFEDTHADLEKFYFYKQFYDMDKSVEKIGAEINGTNLIIEKKGENVLIKYVVPLK